MSPDHRRRLDHLGGAVAVSGAARPPAGAASLLAAALLAAPTLCAAAGPGWISDDWPKALAEAKARKVPIFVDTWAPW